MDTLSPGTLPDDVDALKGIISTQESELKQREQENYAQSLLIEKLKHQLSVLRRGTFGASSESLDQLGLLIDELETDQAEIAARAPAETIEPGDAKQHPKHKAFPDHLPREEVTHCPEPDCAHCGKPMRTLGEDIREVLDYVPGRFVVTRHIRPKLSCRDCGIIAQSPMPSLPIERGHPGASLLAHVLVSKYGDHLPLYRQSKIYGREGMEIDRSTLADWVGKSAWLLQPLADRLEQHVLAGKTIHTDDTPIPVLDPAGAKRRPDACGVMSGMSVPSARPYRQLLFIITPLIGKAFILKDTWNTIRAMSMLMGIAATKTSSNGMVLRKWPALPISGASCLTATRQLSRPLQKRP